MEGPAPEFRQFSRHRGPARLTRLLAGVGRPSTTDEPRHAADSVIYQVVRGRRRWPASGYSTLDHLQ
jgi:hypothetical protein